MLSSQIVEMIPNLHKWCQTHIEPFMEEDDEKAHFRMEIFNGLASQGLTGVPISTQYGGLGLGYFDYTSLLQVVAMYSVPYAVTVSVSTMVQNILEQFGSTKQKDLYLPALTAGEEIGAFALSESHSGSDAAGLKTQAKKTEKGYILNGRKMWITSAGVAKTYIVMARTGEAGAKGVSAFILRDGTPGLSFGKLEKKMGWKTSPTREVILDNCLIPFENLIGIEGKGFEVAKAGLDKGRVAIASIGVGCALRSYQEAAKYSLVREQFGQPLFDFQGIQFMLAEMITEIEASGLLVKEACRLIDLKKSSTQMASMAKMKATDVAMKTTTDAVQILGGNGYTAEYKVERFMRDAKVLQIVEGTNQIQKVVIARQIKKEFEK